MTKAIDIIKPALMYIGAHSEVMPARPQIIEAGVGELSNLLSELADNNIVLGEDITLPTTTATDILEPAGSTSPLKYLLAEKMAPLCQLPIKPDVMRNINKAMQTLKREFRVVEIPRIVPSRLAPLGQGNSKPWGRTFFNGTELDADSSPVAEDA